MIEFRIINDPDKIKSEEVLRLLKMTYWANNRTIEQIEESMASSFCYGLFPADEDRLIGFARVISDLATTYYLCYVIIDPEYQHFSNNLFYGIYAISKFEHLFVKSVFQK